MDDDKPYRPMEQDPADAEIDLLDLFQSLWEGRWKIAATMAAFIGLGFLYQLANPPHFTARTEFTPISSAELQLYTASNALGFFEVDASYLFNLYVEQLERRDLFEAAIQELELLDPSAYEDEAAYADAVFAEAYEIEILPPEPLGEGKPPIQRRTGMVEHQTTDPDKWLSVLNLIHSRATERVRAEVESRFADAITIKRASDAFELEDVDIRIQNALDDYERTTQDRLVFLQEQADIARALGVTKNTVEAQTFNAQSSLLTNVDISTPFYLRGYKAIEKEIQLIQDRSDKKAFVKGLRELEQRKREVEQDRTLDRAKALFATTPVALGEHFEAVTFRAQATEFESSRSLGMVLALAAVNGLMLGALGVLIGNALRQRRQES